MPAFIAPPKHIPLLLRLGVWISERTTGRTMLPARILAWYPKAALGAGVMESLVAHNEGRINTRMLQLVRMTASFAAACPFCIDMNSFEYHQTGISAAEAEALRTENAPAAIGTFSAQELLAIRYARLVSQTPLNFPPAFIAELTAAFTEKEIVILASTAAQVNYWARLIQALGIPPAGFSAECKL